MWSIVLNPSTWRLGKQLFFETHLGRALPSRRRVLFELRYALGVRFQDLMNFSMRLAGLLLLPKTTT